MKKIIYGDDNCSAAAFWQKADVFANSFQNWWQSVTILSALPICNCQNCVTALFMTKYSNTTEYWYIADCVESSMEPSL